MRKEQNFLKQFNFDFVLKILDTVETDALFYKIYEEI